MGVPPALPSSEGPAGSLGNASRREFIDLNYISNYIWYLLAWRLQLDNAQQIRFHLFQLPKNIYFLVLWSYVRKVRIFSQNLVDYSY